MKTFISILLLLLPALLWAQPSPMKTTPFTRGIIGTNEDAGAFRAALGLTSTNLTSVTNYQGNGAAITNLNASQLSSGTVPLGRLSGITGSQIADSSLGTNEIDSTFYGLLTATDGNATSVVLRGAVDGLVTTNGTGDWTITGNAATATNLYTAGGTISEVPFVVSVPGLGLTRFDTSPDFTYDSTADALTLGESSQATALRIYDTYHDDLGTRLTAYDGFQSTRGFVITNGGTLSWRYNGDNYPLFGPQMHNGIEPIAYSLGFLWKAAAWYIGGWGEGNTNSRFSFVIGEFTPVSMNIASANTNRIGMFFGTTGSNLRRGIEYNAAVRSFTLGTNTESMSVEGTNVLVTAGTNFFNVKSNGIYSTDIFIGDANNVTPTVWFWDALNELYRKFAYDQDTEQMVTDVGLQVGGNISSVAGTYFGNGNSLTNMTSMSQTNIPLNTVITNHSGKLLEVKGRAGLALAAVAGRAALLVMTKETPGGTFTPTADFSIGTSALTVASGYTNTFCEYIAKGGAFYITNASAGSGNDAVLVSGSGRIIYHP